MPSDYSTNPFINQCFRGLGHFAYHSKALSKLSPENRDLFLSAYQESLGLSADTMQTTTYIKNFKSERKKQLLEHGVESDPSGLNNLEKSLEALDKTVQNIGARYHPHNLTRYLNEERKKTLEQIDEQRKADLKKAADTITDPDKRTAAEKAINSFYDAQKESLKENITKNIDALHQAVEKERLRVSTFAALRHGNEQMRKAIDKGYLSKESVSASVGIGGEGGIFKDMPFKEFCGYVGQNFKTLTGQTLQVQKKTTDPETYEFNLSLPPTSFLGRVRQGINPFSRYYSDPSDRAMQDMLLTATLLKMSGEKKPYARITCKKADLATKLAQDAFAALRMAGYEEGEIKIYVNGKAYAATAQEKDKVSSFDELFKDNPSRKTQINMQVSMQNIENKPKEQRPHFEAMKKALDDERKKYSGSDAPATKPPAAPPKDAISPK